MEVAEMKMLRFSLGKKRLDRSENAIIRGSVKVGELVGKIRESRLRWFGHVERREDSYVGRRVQTLQTGMRRRGRPKRRWKDCVSEDLCAAGVQPEDAQDRAKWRGQSAPATPPDVGMTPVEEEDLSQMHFSFQFAVFELFGLHNCLPVFPHGQNRCTSCHEDHQ